VAGQIIEVETLHHDDDGAVDLVVETGQERVLIPLDGLLPDRFGLCVLRLDGKRSFAPTFNGRS
jgi:hypothetical protein